MEPAVVSAAAERIAEHVRTHDLDAISIRLHGGEPLLAGASYLTAVARKIQARLAPTPVAVSVQTNGVLLDEPTADALVAADVSVGISLDGDRAANDRHRLFHDGRSSYDAVVAAIHRMLHPSRRSQFGGVLSTIQLTSDPIVTWESLLGLGVPHLDFLLPHGTWERLPPGLQPDSGGTPYADWLIPLFDRWFDAPIRPARVRIFDDLLNLVLGGTASYESFGLQPVTFVVIEADGSYEQLDSMKAVHEGAAATGLNVFDHPLDDLLLLPAFVVRQTGIEALSRVCRRCDHVLVCGGGLYPHRYRPGHGYDNPSVYCADLYRLIGHVESRAAGALAAQGTSIAAIRAASRRV
jgi:uncharacterized protein